MENIKQIFIENIKFEKYIYLMVIVCLIIFLMFITIKIGNKLINKFVEKQINSRSVLSMDLQTAKTLGELIKSILKYLVYFIGTIIIIYVVFGKISFTFAGFGGIALGIGAQSLVKDLINGFFILFENQFAVGDYVSIQSFKGTVMSIGIRNTVIKDYNGATHCISNGSILQVTNYSRSDNRFTVDVTIDINEDIDKVINLLNEECCKFRDENDTVIQEDVEILGIVNFTGLGAVLRITGLSKELTYLEIERKLRKRVKEALDRNGIRIACLKS